MEVDSEYEVSVGLVSDGVLRFYSYLSAMVYCWFLLECLTMGNGVALLVDNSSQVIIY